MTAQEDEQLSESWHRHRARKSRGRKKRASFSWTRSKAPDVLLLLLLLLALLLLLDPLAETAVANAYPSPLWHWLMREGGLPIIGAGLLLGTMLPASLRLRWRINHHTPWWARSCPKCRSANLSRIHRTRLDKLVNYVGIPIRRYICRDCHWKGARIDERRVN